MNSAELYVGIIVILSVILIYHYGTEVYSKGKWSWSYKQADAGHSNTHHHGNRQPAAPADWQHGASSYQRKCHSREEVGCALRKKNKAKENTKKVYDNNQIEENINKILMEELLTGDFDESDYAEALLRQNVTKDIKDNHKKFVNDTRRFNKQASIPFGGIEAPLTNYHGIARRRHVNVDHNRHTTFGVDDKDLNKGTWSLRY